MNAHTTRRQLLRFGTSAAAYAAGAAIVAGGATIASEARGATPSISPALSALLTEYDRADATIDRFYETTFNPAVDRHHELRAAIPHVERDIPAAGGRVIRWSTDRPQDVANARGIAGLPSRHQNQKAEWQAKRTAARSFYAVHLRRQRALERTAIISGSEAVRRREDELFTPIKAATDAIKAFPVASAADMAAKLGHLERVGVHDADDLLGIVLSDAQRLAGEARA
jgi:hypothetical protein